MLLKKSLKCVSEEMQIILLFLVIHMLINVFVFKSYLMFLFSAADDEDAGDDQNDQEADPDEKDPDDAGEEEEQEEDQNSRQHQVHYGDRTLKGASKQ